MSHGPAVKLGKDLAVGYKTTLGIWMFFLYTIIYAGFVIINVYSPTMMELDVLGVNLAVVYGFGLIVFAMFQALIYNHLCTKAEARMNT
ncbi:DUF485 domain-containing protein [Solidesulfovibrio sp.]